MRYNKNMEKSLFTQLRETLLSWYKTTDERTKLQHSYLAIAVVLIIVAGLVGLANYQYGRTLLEFGLMSSVVFVVNAVIWALLQSFVLARLEAKTRANKRSK